MLGRSHKEKWVMAVKKPQTALQKLRLEQKARTKAFNEAIKKQKREARERDKKRQQESKKLLRSIQSREKQAEKRSRDFHKKFLAQIKEREKLQRERLHEQQKRQREELKQAQHLLARARKALGRKKKSKIPTRYLSPKTIKKEVRQIRETGAKLAPEKPRFPQGRPIKGRRSGIVYAYGYRKTINYDAKRWDNFVNKINAMARAEFESEKAVTATIWLRGDGEYTTKSGTVLQKNKIYSRTTYLMAIQEIAIQGFEDFISQVGVQEIDHSIIQKIEVRVHNGPDRPRSD